MAKNAKWLFCVAWLYAQDTCAAVYELAGNVEWPTASIEVRPSGRWERVDTLGFFHIHGLCAGTYTVRVWFEGHIVAEASVRVPQEAPLIIEGKEKLHAVVIEGHAPQAIHVDPLRSTHQMEGGLAAFLRQVPGIALSQTGPLISKPIIEGMRGTRIAYWQGGQPLASQQWGEEHAPEIDPLAAEEVEVRIGPSPLRHGTEAIGGAIILPVPSVCCLRDMEGRVFLTGMTNGQGGGMGLRLQGTLRQWGYRLQGSLLRLGTLQAPQYYLTGTGTQQAHGSFTLHRLWTRWQFRLYYAQYNARIGIFQGMHTGNLSDLQRAITAAEPLVSSSFSYRLMPPYQDVEHELVSLSISHLTPGEGVWTLTGGRQFNRRQERDLIGIYSGGTGVALDLQLTTHFVQISYEKGGWESGVFLQHQRNYRQYAYFIPSYERWQGGVFAIYRWGDWEAGFRAEPMSYKFFRVILREGGMPVSVLRRTFLPVAAGISYNWRVRVQASLLTRAPNPAELYAFGYHQAQAAFFIGGNTLHAEPTAALRLSWDRARLAGGIGMYYSPAFIRERIGDPVLSLRGAALSILYEQHPAVWLSVSGRWTERLSPHLTWELRGAYLWGNVYPDGAMPMPLLPPLILIPVLRAQYGHWEGELYWQQHFRQGRYSLTAEYLPPPAGYGLFGGYISWRYRGWRLMLSGENLLNRRYRAYPDLMRFFADQMGRQVRLTAVYDFTL